MAAKPLLTFDLDGVLCRPPFGINPGTGKGKRRDARGHKNLLWRTEAWRAWGRKPMPGAIDGFKELQRSFDCQVLTARAEIARGLTEQWFRHFFHDVPLIHMRPAWDETPAAFKVRKVGELGPIAHFEDDPFTAQWISEILPQVFVVDWKRNRALSGPNIVRITNVREAVGRVGVGGSLEGSIAAAEAP